MGQRGPYGTGPWPERPVSAANKSGSVPASTRRTGRLSAQPLSCDHRESRWIQAKTWSALDVIRADQSFVELLVEAAAVPQLVMGPAFNNPAVVEHDDDVCVGDSRQAMSDHQR